MARPHSNDNTLLRFCTGLVGSLMTLAGIITLTDARHIKNSIAGLVLLGMGLASVYFAIMPPEDNSEHESSAGLKNNNNVTTKERGTSAGDKYIKNVNKH